VSWRIPLADVRLSPEQRQAVVEVLDSGWLSMGPQTAEFERQFASSSGARHAVCVSSATAGLLLAMIVAGVGPGDEVVMPSLTFVADANVARVLGATPVFADIIDPVRPIVDHNDISAAVTPRTRAVVVVHYGGYLAPASGLSELRSHGVAVIQDAAHAVGPVDDAGSWLDLRADLVVFSFFANKNLGIGEGGMVTTPDVSCAERLRLLRSHGMTTGTWDRHKGHASDYDVVTPGWNFRPTEVAAALGRVGLSDLKEHNAARRRALDRYHDRFRERSEIRMTFSRSELTAGHLAVAVLPAGGRKIVRDALAAAGIQTSFHYPPIHRFSVYSGGVVRNLPKTELAEDQLVTLPLYPWLTDTEVDEIVDLVIAALE
jgi:dTDP-4-amino-4,6-dideoxygalactose transaminase